MDRLTFENMHERILRILLERGYTTLADSFRDMRDAYISLESVRSEARNAALEEAAKVCAKVASPEHWRPLSREAACIECAAAIRALGSALSPARVAEGEKEEK